MIRVSLQKFRINPLGILSAIFMILAPLGAWMTLSAFGYTSQSNLFEIIQSRTSFPLEASIASTAVYSSVLLIFGGLTVWKRPREGLLLAIFSLALFVIESFSTFGMFPGAIPVSILPGTGFFLGVSGILLGAGSLRSNELPIPTCLATLKTGLGLGEAAVVVSSIFLAADGWTHWSDGELSGFLGGGFLEGSIHRVFFMGVAALLVIFLVNKNFFLDRGGGLLVAATFGALLLDGVYHFTTGNLIDFVGHDAIEVLLHTLSYYGLVTLVVARFFIKQNRDRLSSISSSLEAGSPVRVLLPA